MRLLRSTAFLLGCVGLTFANLAPGAEPPPRLVAAWAGGPMEARLAFDRPVDPEVATRVVGESITFGEAPRPGVAGRPGGERGALRVAAARLVDGGRTLVLITDPHPREATYRLALPGVKPAGAAGAGAKLEVAYDLGGIEVAFAGENAKWTGWWPSLDPEAARKQTTGSAEHDRFWSSKPSKGALTLQTLVNAPAGNVSLDLDASSPFEVTFGVESSKSAASKAEAHLATLKAESTGEAIFFSMSLPEVEPGSLRVRASTGAGPLANSAFVLPWAPPTPSPSPATEVPAAFLSGGDPAQGEAVFYGEQAKCSTCHQVRGKGGLVGPDLTSLTGADRAWVYRNIMEPSASIHPEYVSYTVSMKDGRVAMGVVRAEGADALKVGDIDAKQTVIPRAEVEEIRPSPSSIMPVGLLGAIGDERTRDLLAYLTGKAR
jgi:putative heme-binding domain-containing protein